MATTVKQPAWQAPEQPPADADLPPISVYNSLTRSKTQFVPIDWKNRSIKWYACGPTVYDDAHLGHGRNYVSTDIIRRILVFYFKFKVHFCMNITDVDDKIIIRGRHRHLLYEYNRKRLDTTEDAGQIWRQALSAYISENLPDARTNTEPGAIREVLKDRYGNLLKGPLMGDQEAKTLMHIRTVTSASNVISPPQADTEASKADLESLDDVLMPYFDSRFGSSVDSSDLSIWTRLTREYEDRFTEDMRALNVLDPDEVTRVTEFGESIVSYIKTIQEHKFAYAVGEAGSQSVYFDINAFEAANNSYARLEPWNRNDKSLQADGEGSLTEQPSDKRGAADFALWKASRAGEPSWPSPWGPGRPGWHIECSAMASDRLGSHIDIHSGGIDLAFPHHDNELAQSEAYWSDGNHKHQHQWINYFLHMGHLSIQGSKMSKSLKNFTTIRTALARGDFTPRSLRIIFLLGVWRDGIEITDSLVKEGSAFEDKLNNFFLKAKDIAKEEGKQNGVQKPETKRDEDLLDDLEKAEKATYDALCDNFHTPTVLAIISELISKYNKLDESQPLPATTIAIARWVTSMVNIFGLNGTAGPDDQTIGWSGIDVPEAALPVLTALSFKRDLLRDKAAAGTLNKDDLNLVPSPRTSTTSQQVQNADTFKDVLSAFNQQLSSLNESTNLIKDVRALADELRDVHLFDRGVYLEDREHQPALIRPVTKELKQARQEKESRALEKQRAKEHREKEAVAKAEKGRLSHKDMFKTKEYSAWDPEGVPTHEKEGEEVTKSKRKKLQKDWERQKKLHEAYLKTVSA